MDSKPRPDESSSSSPPRCTWVRVATPGKRPRRYTPVPVEDRFWAKVTIPKDVVSGCWVWNACRDRLGYGHFDAGRRSATGKSAADLAHRVSFRMVKGEIPKGLVLDHLCRNPSCVNPGHLEAVTNAENIRRGVESRRS